MRCAETISFLYGLRYSGWRRLAGYAGMEWNGGTDVTDAAIELEEAVFAG